jgi:hypothetical protein
MRDAVLLVNRLLARAEPWRGRRELAAMVRAFDGLEVLEVGGPSRIFMRGGLLPIYERLAAHDMADRAESTLWDIHRPGGVTPRRRFLAEAGDLGVPNGAYGGLLASHVLEHLANPLAALREWRRAVVDGGPLLIVVPHRDYTFDHSRAVTPIEHLVEDDLARVGEDDLTHVEQILARHDPRHDHFDGSWEAFEQRCRDNAIHRGLHHHVFVTRSAAETAARAGLRPQIVTARRPHHIAILARGGAGAEGAEEVERVIARALARSPFPSDDRGRR